MATQTSTMPGAARAIVEQHGNTWFGLLPALSLWWREIVRFYRQPSRVVGVIASPILFWLVIGSGFGTSIRSGGAGGKNYLTYFFPGALIMIVLFTSIFTMMSVIEDRREGFLLSVLVAPVSRGVIVLGKVLGGTTLSAIQGLVFLAFAPVLGVHLGIAQLFGIAAVVWAFVISIVAHFAVGAVKSLITLRSWWASGLEMTIVGVIEAAVTYGLGLAFGAIS